MEVEDGAVHEIPALPSDAEVTAGVAEADAHGAGDTDAQIDAGNGDTTGQEG